MIIDEINAYSTHLNVPLEYFPIKRQWRNMVSTYKMLLKMLFAKCLSFCSGISMLTVSPPLHNIRIIIIIQSS